MINVNLTSQAHVGMPVAGRVRVAPLRRLPMTAVPAAWMGCASVQHVDATGLSTGTDAISTDAVSTDAFPGTSAWSPPI